MAVFNVSYDLHTPSQKYNDLKKYLESFPSHFPLLDSHWLVESAKSASEISDEIDEILDDNDRWLVMRASEERQGWLSPTAWAWIESRSA